MNMGRLWIDSDNVKKLKYLEETPSQCHFTHPRSHRDWLLTKSDAKLNERVATNRLRYRKRIPYGVRV